MSVLEQFEMAYITNKANVLNTIVELVNENNENWKFDKINIKTMTTSFIMYVKDKKVSVGTNPFTDGVLETLEFKTNGEYDHDSLHYHETIDDLKTYLKTL